MECVSEPELHSARDAVAYLESLRRTLLALEVSDVKMEEGSLRCDANVSMRPAGTTQLGTKSEIKNMNSFRSVERAIASEIERQIEILESGGRVVQETRGWDELHGVTHSMRSKEEAHDYRYFPDPDLVPLAISRERRRTLASGTPHAAVAALRTLHRGVRTERQCGRAARRQYRTRAVFRRGRGAQRKSAAVEQLRARRALPAR